MLKTKGITDLAFIRHELDFLSRHNDSTKGYSVKHHLKEELHELITALESNIHEDIIEELADVLVLSFQLFELSESFEDSVMSMMRFKIKRTYERLGIRKEGDQNEKRSK